MKRGVEAALMVSLLEDAYNLWMCEGLSTAAYKGLAEGIMEKADELLRKDEITPSDWDAVHDEFESNQLLVDDGDVVP